MARIKTGARVPVCGSPDHADRAQIEMATREGFMPKPSFYKHAGENVHFEFEAGSGENPQEVEVYIGGYYLCSVDIADISPEAKAELFN